MRMPAPSPFFATWRIWCELFFDKLLGRVPQKFNFLPSYRECFGGKVTLGVNSSFLMVRHKTLLECEISLVFHSDSFWGRSQNYFRYKKNIPRNHSCPMRAWSGSRIHTICHTVHHKKKRNIELIFEKRANFWVTWVCAWNKNLELKTSNNGEKMNKKTIVLWARLFTKKNIFTNLPTDRGSPTPETDPVTQKSISNGLT